MVFHRLALLGDPVEHSRSPAIHRVLLDLSGLVGEYTTVRTDRTGLAEAIDELRGGSWHGLNVTMPLKRDAAELADRLAPEAAGSSSVNTLVLSDGAVIGHSTDSFVFSALFSDPRFDGDGPIHVLGAGATAAAALAAVSPDGVVYVSARRPEAARALLDRLGGKTRNPGLTTWEVVPWKTVVAGALVVNTTPLGMGGQRLPGLVLEGARGLIDLPYATEETPAVAFAGDTGIPVADGNEFLVRQAIASFTIWTGAEPAYETVIASLRKP